MNNIFCTRNLNFKVTGLFLSDSITDCYIVNQKAGLKQWDILPFSVHILVKIVHTR